MTDTDVGLSEADQLYRTILSNIADAVFITTDDGRFTYVCPNAHVIFGLNESEVWRLETIDRLFGCDLAVDYELPTWQEVSNVEYSVRDRNGQTHVLLVNMKQVEIGQGRVLYTCRDISQRADGEKQLRRYRERLRALALELSLAESKERRRVAQALHDTVGQSLIAVSMKIESIMRGSGKEIADELRKPVGDLKRAIHDCRQLTFELSPPILYDLGLVPALEWLRERMEEAFDLQVRIRACCAGDTLPEETRTMLFQWARELLTNVAKHAQGTIAEVVLECCDESVSLAVADDGRGFDPAEAATHADHDGFGLFSIRERLDHLGGRLEVESSNAGGAVVRITLPLVATACIRE